MTTAPQNDIIDYYSVLQMRVLEIGSLFRYRELKKGLRSVGTLFVVQGGSLSPTIQSSAFKQVFDTTTL